MACSEAKKDVANDCGLLEIKVTSSLHAVMPTVIDLMLRLILMLGLYHYVVDLASAFFSMAVMPDSTNVLSPCRQWTFQMFLQDYLHSLTLCHGLVAQELATWTKPYSVSLFHYVDDTMLNSDYLTDLGTTVHSLKKDLLAQG